MQGSEKPSILEIYCMKDLYSEGVVDAQLIKAYGQVLGNYINGTLTIEQASAQITNLGLSLHPLITAHDILATEFEPVPNCIKKKEDPKYAKKRFVCTWSDNEDKRLIFAIHKYGSKDYETVAKFVGNNRSRSQCSQRWERTLNPYINKAPWTQEEESMLIKAVARYGNKAWTQIANCLNTRTDVQCRYHYKHVLNGKTKKSKRSEESKQRVTEKPKIVEPTLPVIKMQEQPQEFKFLLEKYIPDDDFIFESNIFTEEGIF